MTFDFHELVDQDDRLCIPTQRANTLDGQSGIFNPVYIGVNQDHCPIIFSEAFGERKKNEKYCKELWWFESLPQSDHWRQPLRHSATDAKVADASMSLPLLSIQSTKPKEGDK